MQSQNFPQISHRLGVRLLTGRYMVGSLSFSSIPKIGPIPTPATPLDQRPVSSRASLPVTSQPRAKTLRTLLGCQLPPRCRNAAGVQRVGNGPILPAVAAAITALRLRFRKCGAFFYLSGLFCFS
jgi:hypothetical protein